jgi:HTH-type transcriptional regulator/antitoxin HigA
MHELAHIALHVDGTEQWFLDDLDAQGGDQIEQEADALAQDALIPKERWEKGAIIDIASVHLISSEFEISSCIVAGRVRHESSDHKMFGKQFREKVRRFFIE